MIDREKVIKGLECCKTDVPFSECYKCPYVTCVAIDGFFVECNREDMMSDAIALLKAQEPVKPYGMYSEHMDTKWLTCGGCNQPMVKMVPDAVYPNYCPMCGRAVKWE